MLTECTLIFIQYPGTASETQGSVDIRDVFVVDNTVHYNQEKSEQTHTPSLDVMHQAMKQKHYVGGICTIMCDNSA